MENHFCKQTRQYQYDFLRIILVILVVFGHATYMTIETAFGSIEYGHILKSAGMADSDFHKMISIYTDWIYSFHMPAFIALSGTVYNLQKQQGKYIKYSSFVINKAKRLMIPFFIVWLFYDVPIKIFTGYYNIEPIYKILLQIIAPSGLYLWYLEALFIVFAMIYPIDKIRNSLLKSGVIFILWCIGVVLYKKLGFYHIFGDPLYYLLWFYIGMNIEKIRKYLEKRGILTNVTVVGLLAIQIILFIIKTRGVYKIVDVVLSYVVLPMLMSIVLYYFVNHFEIENKRKLEVISSYCMGIYLYAEPLNYLLLYLFFTWFGIGVFASEVGSIILWILRVFLTSIVAIGITWILKRAKLKYLY